MNSVARPNSNLRWKAILLCAIAIAISYVDRVNLATATPTLMQLLVLSPEQMGILMSAFFWPYMLMQMPSGWMLNRFGSKIVMFASCLGWGITTVLTAFVVGFNSFFALRVALGLTESPAFPAAARIVSVWIPKRERTTASAIFDCAARAAGALTMPLVAWVILQWGWKMSFIVTGGIAVVYSFIWLFTYNEPDDHPNITAEELAYIRQEEVVDAQGNMQKVAPIPLFKLFTYGRFNLMCLGYGLYAYSWTAFIMWMPAFLMNEKGLDLKAMGWAAMWPYIAGFIFELSSGVISDKWLQNGGHINTVRRFGTVFGFLVAAGGMWLAMAAPSNTMSIIGLSITMSGIGWAAAHLWAVANDLAPYGQGGGFAGTMNFIGQIFCLIAPMISGFVIGTTFGYTGAFGIIMGACVVAAVCYALNSYDKKILPRPASA